MEHLQSFIADCDRKTELAKRRLKETQEELSEEAQAKVSVHVHLFTKILFNYKCLTLALVCRCHFNEIENFSF